ncbi:hypothetical protein K1719_008966 [Acacia pycnantha]|nr:hypothetical protein K1719_008966 [Acacia pycnantha]
MKISGSNGTVPSKHFARYVTVHESHGRNLYYYFVVSENKPSEDPVVLWLNGGPGCSSFDGFIYEHGDHQISILEICFSIKSQFVFQWSELVPDFQSNPFSISGESYAGIYVPTLASEIGYTVGNGATHENYDGSALVPFVKGLYGRKCWYR